MLRRVDRLDAALLAAVLCVPVGLIWLVVSHRVGRENFPGRRAANAGEVVVPLGVVFVVAVVVFAAVREDSAELLGALVFGAVLVWAARRKHGQ